MISREIINKIFSSVRIEEIISEFVQLKQSGSNLKGLSPFVDEKTPSFIVSPSKQIWKDFSSGKGGSVIGFLMEHEHFSYTEALKYLAKKYNIEIEEKKQETFQQIQSRKLKENLYLIHKIAMKFFQEQIWNSEEGNLVGLNYLRSRSINDEAIKKFQIGYSSSLRSNFFDFATDKGFKKTSIEKSGLCYYNELNEGIDRFRSRIIFPIFNISGRIIGFGGRILSSNNNTAKYLNSPETEIYQKSKVLYGLYQSKNAIMKKNHCFLVEGYTDVISLYQKGIHNVVASLGTSLTEEQVLLIKRFTENITILFDGDSAGIKASFRGIDLLLKKGMNVKILLFPDGHDPDSFARQYNNKEIYTFINQNSTNFIQFKNQLFLEKTQDDPIKKFELIQDVISSISLIDNRIKKEIYLRESSKILNISEEILRNELILKENIRVSDKQKKELQIQNNINEKSPNFFIKLNKEKKPLDVRLICEEDLIQTIFRYGDHLIEPKYLNKNPYKISVTEEIIKQLEADDIQFKNSFYQKIFQDISEGLKNGELRNGVFYSLSQDTDIAEKAIDSLCEKHHLSKNWENKGIYIKDKRYKLSNFVTDLILRYKVLVMNEIINETTLKIQYEEKNTNDIHRKNLYEKLVKLTQIKNKILSGELNQVVTSFTNF